MKRILFYYPSNKRSVQIETTLIELKNSGYTILFLTTCARGALHEILEKNEIKTYTHNVSHRSSIVYYLKQILFLAQFCKREKIDLVFSNLQHVNFIAVFAQFFFKARLVAFRHHFKFSKGNFSIPLEINRNELLFDKVVNKLAKKIIVPSMGVYNGMLNHENVNASKVEIIPYLYDFSQYKTPNNENVERLKTQYPAKLRLIMVARLIPFKRHQLVFPIFKKLIEEGHDLLVFVLDEGSEEKALKEYVRQNKLEKNIIFTGFITNLSDYMEASDLLIHPSLTEASNNVVKEIGLLNKAVAVCKNVGDFDEYIVDHENGFLMDLVDPRADVERIIKEAYHNPSILNKVGSQLKNTVLNKFGNNTIPLKKYIHLIENES